MAIRRCKLCGKPNPKPNKWNVNIPDKCGGHTSAEWKRWYDAIAKVNDLILGIDIDRDRDSTA